MTKRHSKLIGTALGVVSAYVDTASAFSLGLRPHAGMEILAIPVTQLSDPGDNNKLLTEGGSVHRYLLFYGGDLLITPVEIGSFSASLTAGYRMMTASTNDGVVKDNLSARYVPLGLSLDYAIKKFRASGYFSYDLGVGQKFVLQVSEPANSLDTKMSGLSRVRFGVAAEFFISKSLSIFSMADYSMGSYTISGGSLFIQDDAGTSSEVNVLGGKNKFAALNFGAGIAVYFPPPTSQRDKISSLNEAQEQLIEKTKKGKAKPKKPTGRKDSQGGPGLKDSSKSPAAKDGVKVPAGKRAPKKVMPKTEEAAGSKSTEGSP